ncbi:MAG: transcriptional regulator, partial [Acidobacteriota bacterium]
MKELAPNTYTFAEYELDLARRLLSRAGRSIPLNAKAFDLLVVLIEKRERVIAKEELMNLVWRDQFVEEANLTVQISALRKILGEKKDEHRFIVTVPGRGYRFVADVQNGGAKPNIVPDIVIETHTTSHVLVEEEVVTEPETNSVIDTEWTQARAIENREAGLVAYDFEPRPNQPSVIDITPEQLVVRQDDEVWRRRRLHIAWPAAVLGLLFLGGVGFWVYRSRTQNRQATASFPSRQITIHPFTTTGGVPYRAAISPDGKSLVYRQRINGKDSLWLG